jgi:hypothetical protein
MLIGQDERKIHGRIFDVEFCIVRYCRTSWGMLAHPSDTLMVLSSANESPSLVLPGLFLIFNIILASLLAQILGYEIAIFPFTSANLKDSGTWNWLTKNGFPVLQFIQFIVGLTVFVFILRRALKHDNLDTFVPTIFSILCYSSVVYLPFVVIKRLCDLGIASDMFDLWSSIFSGLTARLSFSNYLKLSLYLLIQLFLLFWWLCLVYKGIRLLFRKKSALSLMKVVTISYFLFLIVQMILFSLILVIENSASLRDLWTLATDEITKEVARTPPHYLKAAFLADRMSEYEGLPEYGRYTFKLKKLTYTLADPLYKQDNRATSEMLRYLKAKDYKALEDLLGKYLKRAASNDKDPRRPLYVGLMKDLDKAVQLRTSPTFVDLRGKSVNLGLFCVYRPPIALFP